MHTPIASVLAESATRGRNAGLAAASWKFDGNTTPATYAGFLAGLDDGDPMTLDAYAPPAWLSGEWAGESVTELLGDLVADYLDAENPDSGSDELAGNWDAAEYEICLAYETAANVAYWDALETAARCAVATD